MPIIKVKEVTLDPRQREDYGDLADLARSLADPRFGQLQPILLSRDNHLLAGGRRFAAACLLASNDQSIHGLGPGEILFEYKDAVDPLVRQLIELEENIRRKDLTWQEEQKAIALMHQIKLKTEQQWDANKTAELIGMSKRTVYNALELDKAIDTHEDVAKADTPSGAMQRLNRIKQMKSREDEVKVLNLTRRLGKEPTIKAEVRNQDALEGLRELADKSVDLVIMNPPFGVEIEELFTSDKHIYDDEPVSVTELVDAVIKEAYRVLKDDRWLVTFYPTARLEDLKGLGKPMYEAIKDLLLKYTNDVSALHSIAQGALRRHGFAFQQVPAVWTKPNKRVSSLGGDTYAKLNIQYESFFLGRKGKPVFRVIPPGNVFTFNTPGADRIHPLEMPVDLWTTILRACAVGGETVVEPFAGSGSGGEAAIGVGCNYLGFELDPEFALRANTRLVGALSRAPTSRAETDGATLEATLKAGLVFNLTGDSEDLFDDE